MRANFVILGTIVTASLLTAVQVRAGHDDEAEKPGALPETGSGLISIAERHEQW